MRAIFSAIAIAFLLAATAGCAPKAQKVSALEGMPEGAPTVKIHMTAEKYKFTPDTVTVKRGTRLVLELESLDVAHEFKLDGYDVYVKIPAKKTVTAELYASKAGDFEFGCYVGLGLHHSLGMKGKLIVEE